MFFEDNEPILCDIKKTDKTTTIIFLEDRKQSYCLFDNDIDSKKVVIKATGKRISRHCIVDIDEETFVLYPYRQGLPYLFKKY